ncbi:unnamed protein product [Rotaria sordida]|uniref:Uncharacterized protein n=1 Tax=Rotaria sordida TaxID=392033 RepID=A0A819XCP8_9BILA|nr:unnamed protein product [Rotaria sordida]
MNEKYPSKFIFNKFSSKNDIFLLYDNNNQSKLYRHLKRLKSNNHGIYLIPTSENAIAINLSFILDQINDKYNDFILVFDYNPIYEDICKQLIETNIQLKNHIQFRCFDHLNEFTQFYNEMTNLQNESKKKKIKQNLLLLIIQKKKLFHSCPFETKQQSSYSYRFG